LIPRYGMYVESNHLNMLKTGLLYADHLFVLVSITYAARNASLCSHGMRWRYSPAHNVCRSVFSMACRITEINGPKYDELLPAHLFCCMIVSKAACKKISTKTFGLKKFDYEVPIWVWFAEPKHLQKVLVLHAIIDDYLKQHVQICLSRKPGQKDITENFTQIARLPIPSNFVFVERL